MIKILKVCLFVLQGFKISGFFQSKRISPQQITLMTGTDFDPQLDLASALASSTIVGSFIFIRSKLNKNQKAQENIIKLEKSLSNLKLKQLSGDINALNEYNKTKELLTSYYQQEEDSRTFLKFQDINLRFRVPNIANISRGNDDQESISASNEFIRITALIGVVISLVYLLSFLSVDPMTSTSATYVQP
jgi:cell fate (sporulation/competence/biofilm development) regulator YlbF (YheA/YmcA/DUF963 family)